MADPTLTDEELAGMIADDPYDSTRTRKKLRAVASALRVSREDLRIANEAGLVLLHAAAEATRSSAPTAAEVTEMVDETAKAEMRRQGRDPEIWDRLPAEVRDQLRLAALDRLRSLA